MNQNIKYLFNHIRVTIKPVLILIGLIWLVELVNILMGHTLGSYGILPRDIGHIYGILTTIFIHANLTHIISNTIPFLILGMMTALH